jgi:hypothetical protein
MPSPPFLGNGVGAIAMQNVEIKVVLLRHLAFGHDDTPSRLRLFRLGGPRNGWAILFQFLVIQVCALPPADGSRTSCPCGDAAASLGAAALASASTRRCSGRTLGAQAASRKRSAMLPRVRKRWRRRFRLRREWMCSGLVHEYTAGWTVLHGSGLVAG